MLAHTLIITIITYVDINKLRTRTAKRTCGSTNRPFRFRQTDQEIIKAKRIPFRQSSWINRQFLNPTPRKRLSQQLLFLISNDIFDFQRHKQGRSQGGEAPLVKKGVPGGRSTQTHTHTHTSDQTNKQAKKQAHKQTNKQTND